MRIAIAAFALTVVALTTRGAMQEAPVVVFERVTLIPMDRERSIADRTVVVRDGQRTTLSVQPDASEGRNAFRFFDRDGHLNIEPPVPPAPPAPPALPAPAPRAPSFDMFPHLEGFFGSSGRLGITVDSLSDQLADYFGTQDGVLVTSVTAGSSAEKAGLKAGDVIVAMNGETVDTPGELSRRVNRLDDGDELSIVPAIAGG